MESTRLAHRKIRPLPRSFFTRPTAEVARDLIGCRLWHVSPTQGLLGGKIVETEAYLGTSDPASHAHRGPTPRAAIMSGPVGIAYVYLSYGVHECFNVVAHDGSEAGAVLIRAIEPLEGLSSTDLRLCAGPGKLTRALGIHRNHNGSDLLKGPLYLERGPNPTSLQRSPRIGISKAQESLLRFFEAQSPAVSATRVGSPMLRGRRVPK